MNNNISTHHGAVSITHPHEVAGIHDEVTVAEHGSALANHDVRVSSTANLVSGVPHDLLRREKHVRFELKD